MDALALLLDIGTTTVKGSLFDKIKNKNISSSSVLNRQGRFGEDIISRIDYSLKDKENPEHLKTEAAASINELIRSLLKKTKYKSQDIKEAFIACNTAMHHLFLGISAAPLIEPPYRALQKSEITLKAAELKINIRTDAAVTILPNIGGFVGSDTLAFIIACNIYKGSAVRLAIDIGTNGEVILGNSSEIFATSTAAGPAFEAKYITCGMPAIEGAIEKVSIQKDNSVKFRVIGGIAPKGICGSGLIDLVAEMLKQGLVDNTGRMNPALSTIRENRKGGAKQPVFILYKKGKDKIYITQSDIRKMQLAKAAIYAAIKILIRQSNIDTSRISKVYITGSFGNSINADNAIAIGLIPKVSASKVEFIKDGALAGLKIYASSNEIRNQLTSILSKIKKIQLIRKDFQDIYADSMGF